MYGTVWTKQNNCGIDERQNIPGGMFVSRSNQSRISKTTLYNCSLSCVIAYCRKDPRWYGRGPGLIYLVNELSADPHTTESLPFNITFVTTIPVLKQSFSLVGAAATGSW